VIVVLAVRRNAGRGLPLSEADSGRSRSGGRGYGRVRDPEAETRRGLSEFGRGDGARGVD
jgi:hypothetical protein